MSISGALSSAVSGLRAASRGAELVSSNISNALTPGYARRELSLSASAIGDFGGVRINGIQRITDAGLASDKRLAQADLSNTSAAAEFLTLKEQLIGTPNNPASLSAQLSGFASTLISASSRPDAPERLSTAVAGARDLVRSITNASSGIQNARVNADQSIDGLVQNLNASLGQVRDLNIRITSAMSRDADNATLLDQRQQLVEQISALVPVKQVPRDNGQIALYSTGGAILLDGTAATIGFMRSNTVTAHQTIDNGTLSGLTLNGTALRTGSDDGQLRGGAISAQFEIRDESGVLAQAQLDAISRDLIERFQDPAVDSTLAPGDAGLFTDEGVAFNPLDEVGLASRLSLNATVDSDQGGEAWRLRDGINAVTPGNVGDSSLLQNLSSALATQRTPASGNFTGGSFSTTTLVSAFVSDIGVARTLAEKQQSYAAARVTNLEERQLAQGVDTDAEIQRLLLIERTYAANAKVIQTVEELFDTLTRI